MVAPTIASPPVLAPDLAQLAAIPGLGGFHGGPGEDNHPVFDTQREVRKCPLHELLDRPGRPERHALSSVDIGILIYKRVIALRFDPRQELFHRGVLDIDADYFVRILR